MSQANEQARTMWRDSLDKINQYKRNTALGRDRMLSGKQQTVKMSYQNGLKTNYENSTDNPGELTAYAPPSRAAATAASKGVSASRRSKVGRCTSEFIAL